MRLPWTFKQTRLDITNPDTQEKINFVRIELNISIDIDGRLEFNDIRPDMEEMIEWCATVVGDKYDFDGNLFWWHDKDYFIFRDPRMATLFLLRFKGAQIN